MPKVQTAQSHAAWDPLFHFVLAPIFLVNFVVSMVRTVHEWHHHPGLHLWSVVVALGLLGLVGKVRNYGLANQDRIIRLEERVRISTLVPSADVSRLSMRQLIALRFASDAELPALVQRTIAEHLEAKAIKESILVWRPDLSRI